MTSLLDIDGDFEMSFYPLCEHMASLDTNPVIYASFSVINTGFDASGNQTILVPAELEQNYGSPILSKASDYKLAVERFEININGVPLYNGTVLGESIVVASVPPSTTATLSIDFDAWSLPDVINKLNAASAASGDQEIVDISFAVDTEGIVVLGFADQVPTGAWSSSFSLDLSAAPILNRILGIIEEDLVAPATFLQSRYPRLDMGDALSHIRITSNLPTVSDIIGQTVTNVLGQPPNKLRRL